MVGADGRSITQIKEDEELTEKESEDHNDYSREDKTFTPSSPYQQQLEQDDPIGNQDTHSKNISYIGLADSSRENSEQPLEEQHQLTVNADKIVIVPGADSLSISDSNILHSKVFRNFKYVQGRLNELISKFGYYSQVCFKCSIDKRNGKVINFEIEGQKSKTTR